MPRVFDVAVVLDHNAAPNEVASLFGLLEARAVRAVKLDAVLPTGRQHELRFAVYGDFGQFVASQHVTECVEAVFHTDMVAVNQRK